MLLIGCYYTTYAQNAYIIGYDTANVGETVSYYLADDNYEIKGEIQWYTGGIIVGSDYDIDYVDITWDYVGYNSVYVEYIDWFDDWQWADYDVEILNPIVVPIPSPPTVQSTNCGNTVLARGTPPSGTTWYWQSSPAGSSTSNSSSTITRTSGSTYYLRAYSNGTWSTTSSSVSYNINQSSIWYQDSDGDGLGNPSSTTSACSQPLGYVNNNNDQCPSAYGGSSNNGCPVIVNCGLSDDNYIHTITPRVATTNTATLSENQKIETVAYFDYRHTSRRR